MSASEDLQNISLKQAILTFFKLGLMSFGGPAAQIALMHRLFVEENKWLSDQQFLNGLSFSMLLPGPEAMQLATFIGWRLHGIIGGIIAGILFIMPGALVIFLLALFYVYFGNLSIVQSAFLGIKAAVLVIVIEALLRVAKKALFLKSHWIIASLAFISLFLFDLPFPLIIFLSGLFGFLTAKTVKESNIAIPVQIMPAHAMIYQSIKQVFIWLMIWLMPLFLIGWLTGWGFLFDLGLFFSKLATVTFGGAYAVLAYMSQQVVFDYGWLTTAQMIDGLGLAETTPGPLILVTEFVGFIAGYDEGGIILAIISAIFVLWVTFAPCFLWIFAAAPYIDWITAQPRLKHALSSITAAVVGVMLSLSLWFALHVLFDKIDKNRFSIIHLWQPDVSSLNVIVLSVLFVSIFLLLLRKTNIILVLGICACLSIILSFMI